MLLLLELDLGLGFGPGLENLLFFLFLNKFGIEEFLKDLCLCPGYFVLRLDKELLGEIQHWICSPQLKNRFINIQSIVIQLHYEIHLLFY